MCKTAGKSAMYTLFSIVGTGFMFFLFAVFKSNPEMYDELKNPDVTCKGLFEAAIAYLVTAVISGAFWIYHVQKNKNTVVKEESAFEVSKKRFHFATTNTEATVPLLKAQL